MKNQLPEPPREEVTVGDHGRIVFRAKDGKVDDKSPYFVFIALEPRDRKEAELLFDLTDRLTFTLKSGSTLEEGMELADLMNKRIAHGNLTTSLPVAPGGGN